VKWSLRIPDEKGVRERMFFLGDQAWGSKETLEKGKGCDIGYALAISSCEEANSVDVCTVTASDAITAFAVPNPNTPRRAVGFFRSGCSSGCPVELITQPTSDWQTFI
jgi:hypothetical protein